MGFRLSSTRTWIKLDHFRPFEQHKLDCFSLRPCLHCRGKWRNLWMEILRKFRIIAKATSHRKRNSYWISQKHQVKGSDLEINGLNAKRNDHALTAIIARRTTKRRTKRFIWRKRRSSKQSGLTNARVPKWRRQLSYLQ